MKDYKKEDIELVVREIVNRTDDLVTSGSDTLIERLYRLLDLPCEACNDGEVVREQQNKINRYETLLHNSLTLLEEISSESVIGSDLEDEIGITREEYNEVMGIED